MATVNARTAKVEVRQVTLTKALLKQVREFKALPPEPFRLPYQNPEDSYKESPRANPDLAVGWFRGTVLGEEYDDFILFAKDGDLYLWKFPRMHGRPIVGSIKQLYI